MNPAANQDAADMRHVFRLPRSSLWHWVSGIVLCLALAPFANAETIAGRVVGVADGDTITVLDEDKVQHKIRLAGIDAPEKKQAFGNQSKQSLSELVFGKTVVVETNKRDKYGRQVGKIVLDGQDINLVQVESGLAWFYRQYQREQSAIDRGLYEAAEYDAKIAKRGLWSDSNPIPPWEFRHGSRTNELVGESKPN